MISCQNMIKLIQSCSSVKNNYSYEFTPTETTAGGTLLYIANHLSY